MSKSVFVEIPVSLFHRYKLYKRVGTGKKLILDYCVDAQREMFDRNQYLLLYHMVLNRITGRLPEADADEEPPRSRSARRGPIAASQPPRAAAPPPVAPLPSNMTSLVEPPGKTNDQPPSDGSGRRYSPSLIDIRELEKKQKTSSLSSSSDENLG
jgi:hypothetical protein